MRIHYVTGGQYQEEGHSEMDCAICGGIEGLFGRCNDNLAFEENEFLQCLKFI